MYIAIAVGCFIILMVIVSMQQQKIKKEISEMGLSESDQIDLGKYLSGHTDLDDPIEKVLAWIKDQELKLYEQPKDVTATPVHKASVSLQSIANVSVLDKSSMESRVTLGRMLAVGIFAFAMKKKQKEELSYLLIEWSGGKFSNETIFEFEGKGAISKSNKARNAIVRAIEGN